MQRNGFFQFRMTVISLALILLAGLIIPTGAGAQNAADTSATGTAQVRDLLNRRCVVCHSCYDAPCQLKLTAHEGVARGGTKQVVYDTDRLTDAPPTRLGLDARTVPDWRALGFHAVTADPGQLSLLERFLDLGRVAPLPKGEPVPQELGLSINRELVCPSPQEFDAFRRKHPLAGMPYAAARLSDDEFTLLRDWARAGGVLDPAATDLPASVQAQVDRWEAFLNADDIRSRLTSRYLFEHLFLARLHFPDDDPRRFFQMVRSTTPPGQPIAVIASRRPFDDPGARPFYYRLQRVTETIVHKEHLVYPFGPRRMDRYRELFLEPDWSLEQLPPYGEAEGGNPFSTFAALPARSRYEFLLDDALFFVRSFIRGPVCHGQTAVNVIEDRFWVSFLDPEADLSVTDPSYLAQGAAYLELPVARADEGMLGDLQSLYHRNQVEYLQFRDARYRNSPAHRTGFGYDAIWDGSGTNPQALITVFRHFDNASAMIGFHGDIPETAWVIDYPVFERIYYNLVAGYDVFGRVAHQLATRLYMDELRMESEDSFLTFMPADIRTRMHDGWYQGFLAELHTYWHQRRLDDDFPTGIAFGTDNPKAEFLLTLLNRGDGLWPVTDPINRCAGDACTSDPSAALLRQLSSQTGPWVRYLPDLSVLLIEHGQDRTEVFSLVHDKAHSNVAFLFREHARRLPRDDTVTVLPGLVGSYPNFFFRVSSDALPDFVAAVKAIRSQSDYMDVIATYGIRRTSPDFWRLSDRLHEMLAQQEPVQAGVLDLNRYKDPKAGDQPS